MNWNETRHRLLHLATGRRPGEAEASPPTGLGDEPRLTLAPPRHRPGPSALPERLGAPRAASLCIASGKGGTGKSVVTASLASCISLRGRTLIVDADLGVGNAHILQDVSPLASLVDVVEGTSEVRDVVVACSGQIDLLGAGSGVPRMADLSKYELHLVASGIEELELDYRFLLADCAAGISSQTLDFARACDAVLIVTTPDLTAMTDAYAFLKVLHARRPECTPLLLVNRARDEEQATAVVQRITRVAGRFLCASPRFVGWLPEDPAVPDSVNQRGAVVLLDPAAPFSAALRRVAVGLLEELGRTHAKGMGRSLLEGIAYPERLA